MELNSRYGKFSKIHQVLELKKKMESMGYVVFIEHPHNEITVSLKTKGGFTCYIRVTFEDIIEHPEFTVVRIVRTLNDLIMEGL